MRRNPKRCAKYVYHTGTLVSSTAREGTSCIKKEGQISNSSIIRWTFFQFQSTSSRKDDLLDIDMVKSRETRNTIRLTNWGRCKKKYFHGIHDRFLRDPGFRNRMIENHRDEELCRRWDAIADEDHTHHLTTQEYSLYKKNWWLHSNKQGSNTVPSDTQTWLQTGIVYLAAIETKSRRSLTNAHVLSQKSTMGTEFFFFYMVELAMFMVDSLSLILVKVTMEMNQVLTERGDLLNSICHNSSGQDFLEFNYSVTDGSFTADSGLL